MTTSTIYASSETGDLLSYHGTTYATARSGGSLFAEVDGQFPRIGQALIAGEFYCWEGLLAFDLSVIDIGATINSAVLGLAPNNGDDSLEDFVFRARDHDYGATIDTGDWVAGGSLSSTGALRAHLSVTSGSWTPNGTYQDFDDDAMDAVVGANIGGTLRLILYSDRLEAGTEPTQAEFRYFGGIGDAAPPRLVVDWTAGSPPVSTSSPSSLGSLRSLRSLS